MPDMAEITRQVVAEQFQSKLLRDDFELRRDLGADDLDLVEIILELETKFDIDFPNNLMHSWRTVGDIIESMEGLARG